MAHSYDFPLSPGKQPDKLPIGRDKPWLAPLAGYSDLPFRLLQNSTSSPMRAAASRTGARARRRRAGCFNAKTSLSGIDHSLCQSKEVHAIPPHSGAGPQGGAAAGKEGKDRW